MSHLSALLEPKTSYLVMGVINVTPDSFSDGGVSLEPSAALQHARRLCEEGADVLDIGGESTAPGSKPVSLEEELKRLEPVVQALASSCVLSIDTYKSQVAEKMLNLGAKIINDVSGLRADQNLARVVAEHKASLILMHSKEHGHHPHVTDSERTYTDVVVEVSAFLLRQVERALAQGVAEDAIALDPGMGRFLSHDPSYSWELLQRYAELTERLKPFPVVVATSRKGFLGGSLSTRDPVSQLTALWAVERGASIVRTHAPLMMQQFLAAHSSLTASQSTEVQPKS